MAYLCGAAKAKQLGSGGIRIVKIGWFLAT